MKRCMKCEFVFVDEYGIPEGCCYGLSDGAAGIGATCPKSGRKIHKIER